MPSPTTSWNLVRVYMKAWRNMDGTLKSGKYKVTIPARITNSTNDEAIPAGVFAAGDLNSTNAALPSLDILVPATDDPDNEQTGWKVVLEVTFTDGSTAETYTIDVPVARRPVADGGNGLGVNLRTIALAVNIATQLALYPVGVAGGLAKLNSSGQVVDSGGNVVTGGGAADWNTLANKPATFAPIVGTTATTAKAGNYLPTWTEITSKPTTFAPTIGSTSTTAVAGNDARLTDARTPLAHTHAIADLTATGTKSATTYLRGDGTWATPATGVSSVASTDITDSTTTGRAVLTAASTTAARSAIGAGTSSLALGTTSSTAKAGDYSPPIADLPAASVLFTATTTRPTARTDVMVIFTGTDPGANAIDGIDVWLAS